MKQSKSTGKAISIPAGLLLGQAVAVCLSIIQASILTYLVITEKLSEKNIGYGIMIILSLTAFLSSLVAAEKIKHRMVLVCMGSGALYWLFLLGSTAAFFGGNFGPVWETGVMVLIGSAAAVLWCKKGEILKIKHRKI